MDERIFHTDGLSGVDDLQDWEARAKEMVFSQIRTPGDYGQKRLLKLF